MPTSQQTHPGCPELPTLDSNAMTTPSTRRDARHAAPDARRRRKWPWIVGASGVLIIAAGLVGAAGLHVYNQAMSLQDELLAAQDLIPTAKTQAESLDIDGATATFDSIAAHTSAAAAITDDPIWKLAAHLPWVGTSVAAATELTAVTDAAITAAEPLLAVAPALAPANLKPVNGAFPLEALTSAQDAVHTTASEFQNLRSRIDAIDTDGAVGQLVNAKTQLTEQIGSIADVLDTADTLLPIVPTLLGGEGEKRYLLVFQNNAESLALGGSSASQTLVRADAGKIEIVDQGSSQTYDEARVDVDLPDSAFALYGDRYASAMNLTPSRPDWPSAAQVMKAFWQRDVDPARIDGVASIDPLALARLLDATGPVKVGDIELTSENAVDILLHDVYSWWSASQIEKTDMFFAAAAAAVFDKLSSGEFDMQKMITAIGDSIEAGNIMYWTDDETVQSVLDDSGSRVTGVLPTSNDEATTVGVYFRDTSASKIDYFMDSDVTVTSTCTDGTMTLTATATLRLDLTLEESVNLPSYVRSQGWKGTKYRTQVFMYAPPGMEIANVSVEGADVSAFRTGNSDLGREVAPFQATHKPGEEFTVTATFTGTGDFGPVDVRTTPMIRPTTVSVADECAG